MNLCRALCLTKDNFQVNIFVPIAFDYGTCVETDSFTRVADLWPLLGRLDAYCVRRPPFREYGVHCPRSYRKHWLGKIYWMIKLDQLVSDIFYTWLLYTVAYRIPYSRGVSVIGDVNSSNEADFIIRTFALIMFRKKLKLR